MELEYCSDCGSELEVGQIGKCDDCQKRRRGQMEAYRALSAQQPRIVPADEQPRPHFVAIRNAVMLGGLCVGKMRSKTMAKRTANALNKHVPNREGV